MKRRYRLRFTAALYTGIYTAMRCSTHYLKQKKILCIEYCNGTFMFPLRNIRLCYTLGNVRITETRTLSILLLLLQIITNASIYD